MTLYTSLFIRNTDSINTAMRHSNKAEQKRFGEFLVDIVRFIN